ncbi:hypothetical protein [Marivita hallyeonensis]|nr:hypothetical protein [Marivita hallyeonensis]
MQKTGGTGYLRFGATPNKRVQDGLKLPLLCNDCEGQFSRLETNFATKVFLPSVNEAKMPKKLGQSDYLFLASLHFRILAYLTKNSDNPDFYTPTEKRLVLSSLIELRQILCGTKRQSTFAKQFLLPLGLGNINDHNGLPTNWNRFIRRHTELDLFGSDSGKILGSYVKLGPWVSVYLMKNDGQPWVACEITPKSKKVYNRHTIIPPYLLNYLIDRAANAQELIRSLSEKQKRVVDEAMLKADFVVAGKQMFDALSADYEAFGPSAFRPVTDD